MSRNKSKARQNKPGQSAPKPSTQKTPQPDALPNSGAAQIMKQLAEGSASSTLTVDQYLQLRQSLNDSEQKGSEQLDQTLLALATAALGVTIVYRESIAPNAAWWSLLLLYAGWGALVGSIIALVQSLRGSQEAFRHQRVLLDAEWETGECQDQTNPLSRKTERLNKLALQFFVAGIVLLLLFSGVNLSIDTYRRAFQGDQQVPDQGNENDELRAVPSEKDVIRAVPKKGIEIHGLPKSDPGDLKGGRVPPSNPAIRERPTTPKKEKEGK